MKIVFVVVILFVSSIYANTPAIDSLKQRIEHLENERNNLRESFENQKNGLDIALKDEKIEIKQKLDLLEDELRQIKKAATDDCWAVRVVLGLISFFAIGAFITLATFWINKKKWMEEKLKELFGNEINDHRELLMTFISERSDEFNCKKNAKIVAFSPTRKEKDEIFQLLKRWKFADVTSKLSTEKFYPKDADVVVFNDLEKQYTTENLRNLFNEFPEKEHLFYLGPNIEETKEKRAGFVNFANTKPQFYGNLINLLYYYMTDKNHV